MEVFNNTSLKAVFDEFGPRISAIIFDNKNPVFIGHPSSPARTVDDLVLKTIGGIDLIGIPVYPADPKLRGEGVVFTYYHPTSFIQVVCTSDENHPNALVDPFSLG